MAGSMVVGFVEFFVSVKTEWLGGGVIFYTQGVKNYTLPECVPALIRARSASSAGNGYRPRVANRSHYESISANNSEGFYYFYPVTFRTPVRTSTSSARTGCGAAAANWGL